MVLCISILCTSTAICLSACGKDDESTATIVDLTVNYKENPIGIEDEPVFSWRMGDDTQGQCQTAYRIVVGENADEIDKNSYIWDTGKIDSDISVAIPYEGEKLNSESEYYWKVYVWDKNKKCTESEINYFETGICDNDWDGAKWISAKQRVDSKNKGISSIEYDFKLDETISGVVIGKSRYEEHTICAIDTINENVELVIMRAYNDEILSEDRIDLGDVFADKEMFIQKGHHMKMNLLEESIEIIVDDILVGQCDNIPENELRDSTFGFWVTRGAYYANYDNVLVKDLGGNILYKENFDNTDTTIFHPYYVKVIDGWFRADSGYNMVSGNETPAPMLKKTYQVSGDKEIAKARLYATAMGIYDLYINGNDICDEYMAPGQSVYNKEVYYRTYDVTQYLGEGDNTIGVMLGHGRYNRAKTGWGNTLAFCGKLVIEYIDGNIQVIVSDESWQAYTNGPIRNDDMFAGEYYDANYEAEDWCVSGNCSVAWDKVVVTNEYADINKVAAIDEPVKTIMKIAPVSVSEPVDGTYVYDFGQNFTGVCKIPITGKKGDVVTIRYAETINKENFMCNDDEIGTVWTENLYTAQNTDYYVIGEKNETSYIPSFVCRGFRYIQITGLEKAPEIELIEGNVLATDNNRTGYFECSDAQINMLYNSIYWSQLSNYVDVPTDCPQRDERFGWGGDAQVFIPTASYNANVYNFMDKYLDAMRLGQNPDGSYPELAPSVSTDGGSNGWSDAGIILVWELYQQYGNKAIIYENFDAMCKYMNYLIATCENYMRTRSGYSDHNAVSEMDDTLCNTAECAYVALLLSKMSTIIGKEDVAQNYLMVYNQYKNAWQKAYIKEDGTIECWLQGAYTLGLAYNLYPDELKDIGAKMLNTAVEAGDYHPNTGYVATAKLLPMLSEYGYTYSAYRLLQQDTYPSWNYMLSMGATTITEGWRTYYESAGGSQYGINGSLNHYALGSVGQWMYSYILGIKRDESVPAFKHFYLEPQIGGGLTYAKGSYESVYGTITSEWKVDGKEIVFNFTIPANTTATVMLPSAEYQNMELEAGKYEYRITCE